MGLVGEQPGGGKEEQAREMLGETRMPWSRRSPRFGVVTPPPATIALALAYARRSAAAPPRPLPYPALAGKASSPLGLSLKPSSSKRPSLKLPHPRLE